MDLLKYRFDIKDKKEHESSGKQGELAKKYSYYI